MHSFSSDQPVPQPPSRRLPPPCWSDGETVALIDCYRNKWYSLRRGNLRAPDWQQVADAVADRFRSSSPAKTSIQCRHKMEKLRKRYRAEIQRLGTNRMTYGRVSSWNHFKLMDDMELGLSSVNNRNDDVFVKDTNNNYNNNNNNIDDKIGVRIKLPNFVACSKKRNGVVLDDDDDDMPPEYGSGMSTGMGMVRAIERLGEGFVRMERMKMEMAREMEAMRMKAEMRQTEMIIEMHRKMWESYANTVLERKKKKKVKRVEGIEG